jgi:predicted dehydrogenase
MPQLRVGIVGCGEVTQILHLPGLALLPEQFMVTALCDVSAQVLTAVGDQWRVANRFFDYNELAQSAEVDVVLIANPNAYHAGAALAAIGAGKHALIEKPMCITLAEADAIIAANRQTGVTVQVGYMRRYAPAFLEACLALPALGDIRLARVHDILGANHLFIDQTSRVVRGSDIPAEILQAGQQLQTERVKEALGEVPAVLGRAYNLLLGLGSHDLSAMRELLGPPKAVLYAAQRQDGVYLSAAFDYGSFVCHYETGIDQIARFDAGLEVYGAKQVLKVQYDTPYVRNLPIRLTVTETNERGGVIERTVHPAWGDPFVAEWQAFYDNIIHNRLPKTSAGDFRQDLELFKTMIGLMAV